LNGYVLSGGEVAVAQDGDAGSGAELDGLPVGGDARDEVAAEGQVESGVAVQSDCVLQAGFGVGEGFDEVGALVGDALRLRD